MQNPNEKSNILQLALDELEQIITAATQAREGLKTVLPFAQVARANGHTPPDLPPAPRRPRPALKAVPAPVQTPAPGAKPPRGEVLTRQTAQVRDLPEPFTAAAVNVALGRTGNAGSSLLNRMKALGWVESPERGLWRRTATYGAKAA